MQLTRRSFTLAALGASLAPLATLARPDATPGHVSGTASRSLLVGRASAFGFVDTIDIFDMAGTQVGRIDTPDSVMTVTPSPDPQRVNLTYIESAAQLDLAAMELISLDVTGADEGGLMFPSPAINGRASSGPTHMVLPTMYFGGVYLYDLATAQATSITEWTVAPHQELIPASPIFGPGGSLAGVWTGDNVFLLDIHNPEQAVALNGHDDELYSTSFAITADEKFVSYTTYDPANARGQVLWQHLESGDVLPVVNGTAWSTADVIPGDPDHFLLFHDGHVERRSLADPAADGDVFGRIGVQPLVTTLGSNDGVYRMIGSRRDAGAPQRWQWLDLANGILRDLPELDGLDCKALTPWEQDPRHLVFGGMRDPDTGNFLAAPVVGLDLELGETFDLLDDVVLDGAVRHSTTTDGRYMLLSSYPEAEPVGTWLLDLVNRTAQQFPLGTLGGALTPEGNLAALAVPTGTENQTEVILFDPAHPADFQSVGAGQVLGWS